MSLTSRPTRRTDTVGGSGLTERPHTAANIVESTGVAQLKAAREKTQQQQQHTQAQTHTVHRDPGTHKDGGAIASILPSKFEVIVDEFITDKTMRRIDADGNTIIKQYKRGRYLGKGGFAKCYELQSMDSGNIYAGKIVPKASIQKPSARKKLIAEIAIHKKINHPNVVKFERFFEDQNNVYIILEICRNQTLMELVKRRRRLTETETQFYMYQLTNTMIHLHGNNIIHSDLKLGNLFLNENLDIRIGDFGLAAKLEHPDERKRTICGTPNYIAPEILDNANGHSFEVDTWAMGVIMYTMLIGQPPFETASVKTTYKKIRDNSYEFPSDIIISPAARSLIERILSSKPHDRPSLAQMREDPFFTQSPFPKQLPLTCLDTPLEWKHTWHHGGQVDHRTQRKSNPIQSQANKENALDAPQSVAPAIRPVLASLSTNVHVPNAQIAVPQKRERVSGGGGHGAGLVHVAAPVIVQVSPPTQKQPQSQQQQQQQQREIKQPSPPKMSVIITPPQPQTQPIIAPAATLSATPIVTVAPLPIPPPVAPVAAPLVPADLWVNKWVDYSNKYGLGYLLSNGDSGVYFNDSSKAILSSNGEDFEYYERKTTTTEPGGSASNSIVEKHCHTLSNYPPSLQKKVTLLKHFMNYLLPTSNGADGDGAVVPAAAQGEGENGVATTATTPSTTQQPRVFVKKWLRTKHAIFFRLSNRTVQVIFMDHTELVLSSSNNTVTYTDKNKRRETFSLDRDGGCSTTSLAAQEKPDLAKRMKYTKDILHHLLSKNQPSSATPSSSSQSSVHPSVGDKNPYDQVPL